MQNLRRVHLNGLRAVEAAGRLGSLARAAEEIGVSPGAVSQQILKTERTLGRVIFDRTPKGLEPTAFGAALLDGLTAGFRELSRAVSVSETRAANILTVSVAPVFAAKWLVPRLSRFNRAHPDLRIRIDAAIALVDLALSDVDVAVRVGDGKWPGVKAELLIEQRIFPVCSPELAKRLKTPADLGRVPVIREQGSMVRWATWLGVHGLSEDVLCEGPSYSDASLCLDAAVAGQGIMLGWQTLATDALADGCLVAPFPDVAVPELGYWLVTAPHRRPEPKTRAFIAWIRGEMDAAAARWDSASPSRRAADRP
ncbi:MAG: LysR substrate-binding domain-containing protein [Inquilinaceae bacterium]